jgi:hypothetical protein
MNTEKGKKKDDVPSGNRKPATVLLFYSAIVGGESTII